MGRYFLAACAALAFIAGSAHAQTQTNGSTAASTRYIIELDTPSAQRELLEKHLELYRWQHSEQMDEGQLRRLARQAPDQIRELLATVGYYTPRITVDVQAAKPLPTVKVSVEPGEPASRR